MASDARHGGEQEVAHHAERQQVVADVPATDDARVHRGEIELAAVDLGDEFSHRHAHHRQQAEEQQHRHQRRETLACRLSIRICATCPRAIIAHAAFALNAHKPAYGPFSFLWLVRPASAAEVRHAAESREVVERGHRARPSVCAPAGHLQVGGPGRDRRRPAALGGGPKARLGRRLSHGDVHAGLLHQPRRHRTCPTATASALEQGQDGAAQALRQERRANGAIFRILREAASGRRR